MYGVVGTFIPSAIGFIRTIRDGQPTTPIVIISPIFSAARETAVAELWRSMTHGSETPSFTPEAIAEFKKNFPLSLVRPVVFAPANRPSHVACVVAMPCL